MGITPAIATLITAAFTTTASAVVSNQASQEAKANRPQPVTPPPAPAFQANAATDAARLAALQQRKQAATGFSSTILTKPKTTGLGAPQVSTPSPLTTPATASTSAAKSMLAGTTSQPTLSAPMPPASRSRLGA